MSQPLISNIQRFSVDDGPGIRTTVFFKGCNLRCLWCHNPECISTGISFQLMENACRSCGKCATLCGQNNHHFEDGCHLVERQSCVGCGKCAYSCPASAISIIGKAYEPQALIKEVLKDRMYFETSNGGVTFSGGEPMLYPDYLLEVLTLAKDANLHTAVDTAGNVPISSFMKVLPKVDVFLFDIKVWDNERHRQATGVSNKQILENLPRLTEAGASVIIRTPVIMEWNGFLEEFEQISTYLANLKKPVELIQLLPYHSYGAGKYDTLGLENKILDHTPPTKEFMEKALKLYLDKGLPARIS